MDEFTYEKFKELSSLVSFLGEQLNKIEEGNHTSNEVDTYACQLISLGNSFRTRIKTHNKIKENEAC